MKAIVTIGISASGKSTFADKWVKEGSSRTEVNRDQIRKYIIEDKDGNYPFTWAKWNWKREKEVNTHVDELIHRAVKHGYDIICSDTNLNKTHRDHLIRKLRDFGYEVEVKEFPVTWEEAVKRDNARANGVGVSVISKQWDQWNEYIGRNKYVPDVTKPKCILVDIDGTAAHMNGKRGAFEWDKVHLDDVDHAVKMMVNAYKSSGNEVIFLSGRDGVCQPATLQWLIDKDFYFDDLIMRAPNDMRKDTVIKEEIFWRDIADNYNVLFVVDDRPSVCRMWRDIGLKVFQVGNPHVEF